MMRQALSVRDPVAARLEAYDHYTARSTAPAAALGPTAAYRTRAVCTWPPAKPMCCCGATCCASPSWARPPASIRKPANILQATQPACSATFERRRRGHDRVSRFDVHMQAFVGDHRPDLAILSADWLEYARPRLAGMIDDLRVVIASLTAAGTRVVLLGPSAEALRRRLPSTPLRAHLRGGAEAGRRRNLLVFAPDATTPQALPASGRFRLIYRCSTRFARSGMFCSPSTMVFRWPGTTRI